MTETAQRETYAEMVARGVGNGRELLDELERDISNLRELITGLPQPDPTRLLAAAELWRHFRDTVTHDAGDDVFGELSSVATWILRGEEE